MKYGPRPLVLFADGTSGVRRLKEGVDPEDFLDRHPEFILVPYEDFPSHDELISWTMDGVCLATDGCPVEPDGHCPHNRHSWLLHLGMI